MRRYKSKTAKRLSILAKAANHHIATLNFGYREMERRRALTGAEYSTDDAWIETLALDSTETLLQEVCLAERHLARTPAVVDRRRRSSTSNNKKEQ